MTQYTYHLSYKGSTLLPILQIIHAITPQKHKKQSCSSAVCFFFVSLRNNKASTKNTHMSHKRLTWACDFIILNAFCITTLQVWLAGMSWLWSLSLINFVAVVALRQMLMSSLQIPGMVSPLNRGIKRAVDILISITFLVTLFPVIIVFQAIIIKSNKRYRGPLFTAKEIWVDQDKCFTSVIFSHCQCNGGISMGMTPLAMHLLTGKISLSNITSLSIKDIAARSSEQKHEEQPNTLTQKSDALTQESDD